MIGFDIFSDEVETWNGDFDLMKTKCVYLPFISATGTILVSPIINPFLNHCFWAYSVLPKKEQEESYFPELFTVSTVLVNYFAQWSANEWSNF